MSEGKLAIVAVLLFLSTPILLMVALGVRFAGAGKVLNCIDADRVSDMRGANRWAGTRLFVLPLYSLLAGIFSLQNDVFAIFALPIALLVGGAVTAWVILGAQRFYTRPCGHTNHRDGVDSDQR